MSHSGNSSSRRLRALKDLHHNKQGEQLYNPTIFRYKCMGALQLNSSHKGSLGVCKGYQSKIERVANMVPDTREAAIKKFLEAASDMGTYVDSDDDTADQKVKEIYTSRTMIYKKDPLLENSIDKTKKIIPAPKATSSPLIEDELINKTEWSCYGSTQVHYLVLDPLKQHTSSKKKRPSLDPSLPPELADVQQAADDMLEALGDLDQEINNSTANNSNQKKKPTTPNIKNYNKHSHNAVVTKVGTPVSGNGEGKVAAITPENIGVSIRKIDSAVGHFTVSDIGNIRICVETSGSLMGDDNDNKQSSDNNNNADKGKNPQQGQPVLGAAKDNKSDEKDVEKKKNRTVDLKKFYNFTLKVGKQMETNVMEIKEAVSDDFPGRSYRFGTLVVNRIQRTTDQTFTYMGKIFDSWWRSM